MYLEIEIFKSINNPDSYNIFYGKNFIGQIKENDTIELFTKDQLIDFYYREKNKFKIPEETIQKLVKKPKSND
tara:strand:+ start:471 stop:689 length:219 start_codon:yes stop_codon:yes gene_type:complete